MKNVKQMENRSVSRLKELAKLAEELEVNLEDILKAIRS